MKRSEVYSLKNHKNLFRFYDAKKVSCFFEHSFFYFLFVTTQLEKKKLIRVLLFRKYMSTVRFSESGIFSYNHGRKLWMGIGIIASIAAIAGLVVFYMLVLAKLNLPIVQYINTIVKHMVLNVKQATYLGVFYTIVIGGLFFVIIPLELAFIGFLRAGVNPVNTIIIFLLGFFLSYSINYFIGFRLANIAKRLINLKTFYSLKAVLNKYGAPAIFFINVFPLPSQILSVLLGVFRYNKIRFFLFFLAGQGVKLSIIAIALSYFL